MCGNEPGTIVPYMKFSLQKRTPNVRNSIISNDNEEADMSAIMKTGDWFTVSGFDSLSPKYSGTNVVSTASDNFC